MNTSEAKRYLNNASHYTKLATEEIVKARLETEKLHKFVKAIDNDIAKAETELKHV